MKELRYLNKYFVKYKYSFLFGIITTVAAQIFSLFTPKLISDSFKAIEAFAKQNADPAIIRTELLHNILLIITTTLIAGVLTFLMRQTLIVMSRHVEYDLKNEVFRHYEVLSQNFYKQNKPVTAVCHEPAALLHAKGEDGEPLIKGKKVTGFTKVGTITNSEPAA